MAPTLLLALDNKGDYYKNKVIPTLYWKYNESFAAELKVGRKFKFIFKPASIDIGGSSTERRQNKSSSV